MAPLWRIPYVSYYSHLRMTVVVLFVFLTQPLGLNFTVKCSNQQTDLDTTTSVGLHIQPQQFLNCPHKHMEPGLVYFPLVHGTPLFPLIAIPQLCPL